MRGNLTDSFVPVRIPLKNVFAFFTFEKMKNWACRNHAL